jgi:hypothetical protein
MKGTIQSIGLFIWSLALIGLPIAVAISGPNSILGPFSTPSIDSNCWTKNKK